MIPISDFHGPDKISHSSTECKAALFGLFFFWSTVNAQLIGEQNFSPVFIRLLRFSHKSFWGYKGDYIIDSKGVNSKLGSYSKDKWGCLWTWRSFILTLTQHAQWALFIFKTMLYSTTTLSVSFQLTVEMPCHLLHMTQWGWNFSNSLFFWHLKNSVRYLVWL